MSQDGCLVFYTCEQASQPKDIIRSLIKLLDPGSIYYITRSWKEEHSWDEFLKGELGDPEERLAIPQNYLDVSELYKDKLLLSMELNKTKIGHQVWNVVKNNIPEEIRGDYLPSDVSLSIGFHDLFECAEEEDGHYIARAFLSISFFGYGTPNDWEGFREQVFKLPEIQAIKKEFELITGPLEECVFWSV